MDDTDLTETTRRMAKEEDLRKKRISERQALVNFNTLNVAIKFFNLKYY